MIHGSGWETGRKCGGILQESPFEDLLQHQVRIMQCAAHVPKTLSWGSTPREPWLWVDYCISQVRTKRLRTSAIGTITRFGERSNVSVFRKMAVG